VNPGKMGKMFRRRYSHFVRHGGGRRHLPGSRLDPLPAIAPKKLAFAQIPRLTKKWTCIFIGQYQPNLQKSANEPVFPFRSLGHETKNGGQVRGSRQVRSARRTKRDE
jgi:hypothetical protein